jgi:hypothetical protein
VSAGAVPALLATLAAATAAADSRGSVGAGAHQAAAGSALSAAFSLHALCQHASSSTATHALVAAGGLAVLVAECAAAGSEPTQGYSGSREDAALTVLAAAAATSPHREAVLGAGAVQVALAALLAHPSSCFTAPHASALLAELSRLDEGAAACLAAGAAPAMVGAVASLIASDKFSGSVMGTSSLDAAVKVGAALRGLCAGRGGDGAGREAQRRAVVAAGGVEALQELVRRLSRSSSARTAEAVPAVERVLALLQGPTAVPRCA